MIALRAMFGTIFVIVFIVAIPLAYFALFCWLVSFVVGWGFQTLILGVILGVVLSNPVVALLEKIGELYQDMYNQAESKEKLKQEENDKLFKELNI